MSIQSPLIYVLALMVCHPVLTMAEQPTNLSGYVAARTVDCLNPEHHDHPPNYYLLDDSTGERIHLKGFDEQLQKLHPRQKIRIKGSRKGKAADIPVRRKLGRPTTSGPMGSGAELEIQEIELLPITDEPSKEDAIAAEPSAANGGNTLTMLTTLLVFISTDTHGCMTSEANARGRLFDNENNANEGMQAITKGRYGLQLGNGTGVPQDHVINLTLNVNSADHNADTIETLALNKLFVDSTGSGGLGLDRLDWNRILLFAPDGITNSGFTAYAYYPWGAHTTHGLVSMYGKNYGNRYMNGYLHELGHNFGFAHSSTRGSEYGDATCVMGTSNSQNVTQTYNVAKLMNTNWLDAFPNSTLSVTTDTTIDLYPLSSDPNSVNEVIAVNFPNTGYYAAYRRDIRPYGFLGNSNDHDKVFVFTRSTGSIARSFQVARIAEATSYNGPGEIIFERYGPNKEYATVSFDMKDGNTKPVADNQSLNATINSDLAIILSGSDTDTDPADTLTFAAVTNPANGTLSGTPPNLTYTPNTDYLGPDSFVFKVNDGKISSFATISITVNEVNNTPVAYSQSLTAFRNIDAAITLTATDADEIGDSNLFYSVVSGPSNGSLSGTPPNLIYTPNNNFTGSDSFTFKASDGQVDSNTATVSITVSSSPNTPPSVTINTPDQAISLVARIGGGDPVADAYVQWDAAADTDGDNQWESTTANTYDWTFDNGELTPLAVEDPRFDRITKVYPFPAAKDSSNNSWQSFGSDNPASFEFVIDVDGTDGSIFESGANGNGMQVDIVDGFLRGSVQASPMARVSYELSAEDMARLIHVVFVADSINDVVQLYIDGQLQDSSPWTGGNKWSGSDSAALGTHSGKVVDGGSVTDFSGKMALFRFYQNKALTDTEVTDNFHSLFHGDQVQLTLDATVTDPEHTPTHLWTDSGTGTATTTAIFSDPTSLTPSVTFYSEGTYVLRLTSDDGYDQRYQEVTITVHPPSEGGYASWASSNFTNEFTDTDPGSNPDGDISSNLMEFAFGTDPTLSDSGPLSKDGSKNGQPINSEGDDGTMKVYFVRRTDGSVIYIVQFSSDLTEFTNSSYTPDKEADSHLEGYEVVSVPYPAGSQFSRIDVQAAP